MFGNQRIQCGDRDIDGLVPALSFPTGRAVRGFNKRRRDRRHCRIIDIDQHARPARLAPHRQRLDRDRFAAAIEQSESPHHRWLRLDGDDARTQPMERSDAIADMCADVEYQIARPDEVAMESVHCRSPPLVSVIDAKRPDGGTRGPDGAGHCLDRACQRRLAL